ncbi:MAG: multifunctional oxoglutarate decarboxylase/oxoglutarate dehydrogenase thiamine pyrophosphate-binding subunit/dihydrolipoyllysine-residue succinyltransferase subunit, partial [Propionicimonas sp.]|nr:multifunctional oxoglutarate decarboxylase/oxoglutarate dehydrogenase thiamine pyrophosphate-binding subunit/dihydrolipoyllysine-residue succinyltransferase subunit [Propionicimonas sp.]
MTPEDPTTDFGANDWLIEELREQYLADPESVDSSWAAYFARHTAASPSSPASPAAQPVVGQETAGPRAIVEPAPAVADAHPAAAPTPAAAPQPLPESEAPAQPRGRVERRTTRAGGPEAPGSGTGVSPNLPRLTVAPAPAATEAVRTPLRGAPMRTAQNMDASLAVPTATSVREVPMKLAIDQRQMINEHLARSIGGKVSFTHLIGYAMVRALAALPEMNNHYEVVDGKPNLVTPAAINLGLAIDLSKPDGTRQLLVPNIKNCANLDFAQFWAAYEKLVSRARNNQLTADDFAGTTASLTNPGGLGTNHSVPRLMAGQSVILGVGSIDYPPEFQGTSQQRINALGVSKVTTLTSTYDHRVIQGAQSGEFLKRIHELLIGKHDFYDQIFASLRVPYTPIRWAADTSDDGLGSVPRPARVFSLINAYRTLGHYMADIDPLEYRLRTHPELAVEHHGLTLWDLDRSFPVGDLGGQEGRTLTMREILAVLRGSYCRAVGVEYMHIADNEQRAWIQERFERPFVPWPREEHLRILDKLNEAEIFETFLQTKFVGQKRFSLEGGESAIVFLDEVCEQAANSALDEAIIGMPHRGRLNVLANIVGKSYAQIFREFDGGFDPRLADGTGDVKYHLGSEGQFTAATGKTIKTSVAANPSHLEAVNPVLEGIVRAKLDQHARRDGVFPVLPVLVHGDASFAGQGVVYETFQMSQLRAYKTGGTIHLVINNQVGFTTAPVESRSSVYATDLAKGFQSPIFHVNGDDPEAVATVAQIAFDFRQRFG